MRSGVIRLSMTLRYLIKRSNNFYRMFKKSIWSRIM